jgi:hypothetical protein
MRSTNSGKDGVLQRVKVSEFLAEENIIELFTRAVLEARTAHRCRWAGQDLWRVINQSEPKMATDAKLERSEPLGMAVTADGKGNDRHLTKKCGESCTEDGSFSLDGATA